MEARNFLETRPRSPVTLGVALAIHGVALAMLLLAKGEVLPPRFDPFTLIQPTLPKNPPPPVPLPKPSQAKSVVDHPFLKTPIDQIVTDDPLIIDPVTPYGGDLGTGDILIKDPPIAPDPVIVGPQNDPRFARDLQPPYPPGLQRLEIEGSVIVRILIGADGRVLRLEAVKVDNEGFLTATREWALRHWRFKPGTRDGVPQEAWLTKTVRFRIGR